MRFQPNIKRDRIFINVRTRAISIALNTFTVLTFDKEGRLIWACLDGHTFRRSLDNRVIERYRRDENGQVYRVRRGLEEMEKRVFLESVYSGVRLIHEAIKKGECNIDFPPNAPLGYAEEVEKALSKVVTLNYEGLEEDKERFLSIYKPVSILPPDQYLALVLQVAEGCWWNRCTFCNLYRDRRFRVKDDEEILKHIKEVKGFLGEGIRLRKSIFLADANALAIPEERFLRVLDIVNQELPIIPRDLEGSEISRWKSKHHLHFSGIYSFLDAFIGSRRSIGYYRELRRRNLKRIYVGLESGSDRVLALIQKPNKAEEALEVVRTIKEAEMNVGVIVMIGIGGEEYFEEHVEETVRVINSMRLGSGDFIYLSEFVCYPELEYSLRASKLGIRTLSKGRTVEQMNLIRQGLHIADPHNSPKIAVYDIGEFIY
ncbi:MAG TPA: radical SAM protein [Thermodesulfobacteriota bacterium]|jgi:hypothetical protein|nr:radical SAM protein [Thermodesulfobacteriota bacterium]